MRRILMAAAATFFFGLLSVIATVQAEESVKVDDLWAGRWSIGRDSGDIKFRLIQTGNNLTGTVLEATGMRHPMEKDLKVKFAVTASRPKLRRPQDRRFREGRGDAR